MLPLCRVSYVGTHGKHQETVSRGHLSFFLPVSHFAYGKDFAVCPTKKPHGKKVICRRLVAVGFLLCATHGKAFAMCKPDFAGTRQIPCVP